MCVRNKMSDSFHTLFLAGLIRFLIYVLGNFDLRDAGIVIN